MAKRIVAMFWSGWAILRSTLSIEAVSLLSLPSTHSWHHGGKFK